jgi:hypothetical protein
VRKTSFVTSTFSFLFPLLFHLEVFFFKISFLLSYFLSSLIISFPFTTSHLLSSFLILFHMFSSFSWSPLSNFNFSFNVFTHYFAKSILLLTLVDNNYYTSAIITTNVVLIITLSFLFFFKISILHSCSLFLPSVLALLSHYLFFFIVHFFCVLCFIVYSL